MRCGGTPGNKSNIATVAAQGVTSGAQVSDEDPANVRCIVAPDALTKEIISGPDFDLNNEIDLAVEVGQSISTEYDFKVSYTNPDGPPVLIEDTVPAEWQAQLMDNDGGRASAVSANKKGNGKGATKIDWEPDPAGGMIEVWAGTRPKRRNGKYAPTACGALYLNDGAQAFELDPVTLEPKVDEFGERLPPILESNQLCLAAVSDLDGGGLIPDGSGDEDADGLTDLAEACEVGTDPCIADTDGDGVPDGDDACPLEAAVIDADGDGCEDPPALKVFVTSGSYTGDLISEANALTGYSGSDGIEAGDAICNDLAVAANLGGIYKAWLSSSAAVDPESTFSQGTVPYVLTDGTQVASNWADLIDASLSTPINKDENQSTVGFDYVWASTSPLGTFDGLDRDCANWSSVSGDARVGRTDLGSDSRWTEWIHRNCADSSRLYCFEQE
jgi:hypothetical protein